MTNQELEDRLAEMLVGYDVLKPVALERARAFQASRGCTLAGALSDLHVVGEDTLRPLLEELMGVRAVDPSLMTVYPDFVEKMNVLIPAEIIQELGVFPAQMEINTIHVCMLNPSDGWTGHALESISGCRIVPLVTHERAVLGAIEKHYAKFLSGPARVNQTDAKAVAERVYRSLTAQPFDNFAKPAMGLINRNHDAISRGTDALEAIIRDPAVIRLVQQILCRAVEMGCSDIHIEPVGDALRIRGRVDGAMRVLHVLPQNASDPVIARLKAMADLPIQPSVLPLDARIGYDISWGRGVDLRFSLVPAVTGEKVVLRVLDRTRERRGLADLGVDPKTMVILEDASELPNGLLLVTGPTGSGKSSTLYALLDRLNNEDTCILTAEDPVESRIVGVTQVQCDEERGVKFALALRSFLRQDPDVLMVGEIRDAETADIALKSALTGHLVLSSLHTNDAPGAVLRLINMNLEPFLIASALRLVVAQRLIRRLCKHCRVAVPAGSKEAKALAQSTSPAMQAMLGLVTIYEPKGCSECANSGYRGRVGIFEALTVGEKIEELIISRGSAAAIRAQARADGMRTLREAGLMKVAEGETSFAEVLEHTITDTDETAEPVAHRA